MASNGRQIIPYMPPHFPSNHLRGMGQLESVESASTLPVSFDGQPSDVATNEHQVMKCEPIERELRLRHGVSNEDGIRVNLDVVPQRRGRPLETSIILGVYDLKVRFIPSSENSVNYELELIAGEKNLDEDEATIPPPYRERVRNWKFQVRKRLQNGRTEKFFYQEGVKKTYRSVPEVTSYILQGEVTHTPRRPPTKRKEDASSSKNGKKAKEDEVAEKKYDSMKEFYDECYNELQNLLDDEEEEGHASTSITNDIGAEKNQRDVLGIEVQAFLAESYDNLLHYFD